MIAFFYLPLNSTLLKYPDFKYLETQRETGGAMTKPAYELPRREWYTLEKACKRIEELTKKKVDIDDLLYYCENGKLVLRVRFFLEYISSDNQLLIVGREKRDDLNLSLHIVSGDDYIKYNHKQRELENSNKSLRFDDNFIEISFNIERDKNILLVNDLYSKEVADYRCLIVNGFLPISEGAFFDKNGWINNETTATFFSYLEPERGVSGLLSISMLDKDLKLSIDDLVLFEKDIISFLNGEENLLGTYVKTTETAFIEKSKMIKNSVRIEKNKNKTIEALFKIAFNVDVNNIRNVIDGEGRLANNRIKAKWEAYDQANQAGLPTGKTIQDWLIKEL